MKIIYDQETDTMTVIFKETSVEESDEAKSGIIIDYDNQGDIVSIEILDAKKRITQPTQIIYQFAEQDVAIEPLAFPFKENVCRGNLIPLSYSGGRASLGKSEGVDEFYMAAGVPCGGE